MSSCTAAEIAEKKRIALEKLKAKKAQLSINSNNNLNKPALNPGSNVSSNQQNNINNNAPKLTPTPPPTNSSSQPAGRVENKASSFLSALKGSNVFVQRQQQQHSARDAAHPYKRPSNEGLPNKDANSFYKKSSTNGYTDKPKGPMLNAVAATTPQKQIASIFVKSVTCKVAMITPARFEVQPSSFHAKLIDVFKSIPSKSYDPNSRYWNFALTDYKLLQERINPLKPDVVIGVIPKAVLNLCQAPPRIINKTCLESIEPKLAEKLMPFQQDGVCFAIAQQGRCMICDEMGLGKTYQAIAVADFYRDDWPLFICTTASTRDSWAQHIRDLLPAVPLHYIQVLNSNQQYIGDCKVLITSYSMMERNVNQLMERKFGFLIFDESHSLKNSKAKCTVVADRLAQQAKHVLLLSGTPALSRPLELFSQLQMVDRKFMGFMDFTSRYCDGKQTNFGWDATGQSNLKELNVVLNLKYMIRRTKAEVLKDLSEKSRETVVLDPALVWPSDEVKESLNAVAKNLQTCKAADRERILLRFYAETAEVKKRAVCAYLKELVKGPNKFIVFAHHRIMMDAISECLTKLKVKFIRIDGNTRKQERGEFIETFQKKPSCKVAVLSLGACNSGITLTAAELIIFAELTWNPSTLAQAESRAHRIGQTNPVTCRYLMATKTADDHIWNMLKTKQDTLNEAGLFCDNLQDATHTAAPITSNKIENYFSPTKEATKQQQLSVSCGNEKSPAAVTNTSQNLDISKEIENIDEFFLDDDDDAFKDIIF
ncbi:SWI/SNF-related matrix-associated actin-dependent regulator of chromatin subfamily A-like protein 1 [Lucilia sericata]|uniref:SWI/SNF-related matrix-associated actin-dependent regulator of chromatin subfamily A-like protein 1 n=1 Tax=Lucilia sericata TaxID=13632 RepID=UPI0018A81D61|nr:SWI/SNF-related matrix-associated actin-dependent regulator of chromatin subfamily A-like protein 1 [Lucilia sericata]